MPSTVGSWRKWEIKGKFFKGMRRREEQVWAEKRSLGARKRSRAPRKRSQCSQTYLLLISAFKGFFSFLLDFLFWHFFWTICTLLNPPVASPVDPNPGAPTKPQPRAPPQMEHPWKVIPCISDPISVPPVLLCTGNSWEEHMKSKGCPSGATALLWWKICAGGEALPGHLENEREFPVGGWEQRV